MQATNVFRSLLRRSLVNNTRSNAKNFALKGRAPAGRAYSTPPPPPPPPPAGKSNTALYVGLGLAVAAGAGFYVFASSDPTAREVATALKSGAQSAKSYAHYVPKKEDYQEVYNKIAKVIDEAGEYDDGSYGPVLVRLAWHSSGTYDKETKTGGSNYATMRFEPESIHGANNGLKLARDLLEPIKAQYPWISYGDLWTLAGVAAIQEMAGPKVPWRPGRIDGFAKDVTPDGRLPNAALAQDHVRSIFYRMGFNDQEIVALLGAHALGRCHTDRSGFEGPWTFSPTTMTNEFYKLLFNEKWIWRKWGGPKQLADKKTGSLMMLPTDYTLVTDKTFKKHAKAYADSQELFFNDFSAAFARLLELGVPESQWVTSKPWELKSLDEQTSA